MKLEEVERFETAENPCPSIKSDKLDYVKNSSFMMVIGESRVFVGLELVHLMMVFEAE